MVNGARTNYLRSLFTLSKSDPRAWEDFVQAFYIYVESELEQATKAPSPEAMVALGMSRRLLDIRNDIRDLTTLVQKINK